MGFICYPKTKFGFISYTTVCFKHVQHPVIGFVPKVNDAVYLYTRGDDGYSPNFPTLFHFPYGDFHFKLLSFNKSFRENYNHNSCRII